jgi:hypothetical protein
VCVCSVIAGERIHQFALNLAHLRQGRDCIMVKTPRNFLSSSPSEVPVARKLSTIEKCLQEQSCLFRRGYYRNKSHKPEKTVLNSSPSEDGFFTSETKHNKRTTPRPKLFVSAGRLQEQWPQRFFLVGASICKPFWFINKFFVGFSS